MATRDKMSNGLIFGNRTGNTTINDLNPAANGEGNDVSDDDYSIESDFEDIFLPNTTVKDYEDEPKDSVSDNYYKAIAFDDNSDYEQNNEENEIDQTTDENITKTNNIVIKPDPDKIDGNSIREINTVVTDKPHLTNNDTAARNNAGDETTFPDMIDKEPTNTEVPFEPATYTRPQQATPAVNPIAGVKINVFTGRNKTSNTYTGRDAAHVVTAYKHLEEVQKLTQWIAGKRSIIACIAKENEFQNGFQKYVNHMLLTKYRIKKEL